MSTHFSRADVLDQIITQNWPVLFLDTCSILDLVRTPIRPEVTAVEIESSLHLLDYVKHNKLFSVITETVVEEFHKNLGAVQNETDEGVRQIMNQDLHPRRRELEELARHFNIDISDPQKIKENYAVVAAGMSAQWVSNSTIIDESSEIMDRAVNRVVGELAPSRKGKDSFEDCVIFESYTGLVRECRTRGLRMGMKLVFVSSNTREYRRSGVTHPDILASLSPLGVDYASSMHEAEARLFTKP